MMHISPESTIPSALKSTMGMIGACHSTGNVSGDSCSGGLVGNTWYGSITQSYSIGTVKGNEKVGGLVSSNSLVSITESYSTGRVTHCQTGTLIWIECLPRQGRAPP
ncbi:GLUG motif-containing protein [Planctomycetota bacterium]